MADLVQVDLVDGGAYWRVTFGQSRGNIIDRPLIAALRRVFVDARTTPGLKAIVLEGAGGHFSFGASVQEHLPEQVGAMLEGMRGLVLDLLDSQVVVLAAVDGQCLGGGLELASACHRIFASTSARFGQPEIALGVFAPIASILLPERIGRAAGEDLCLTGRIVTASEAHDIGLVDAVAPAAPAEAALTWARTHFASRSASSLRLAVKAVRAGLAARVRSELPVIEAIYLNELMTTRDATEGLQAFLDKRSPVWRHE